MKSVELGQLELEEFVVEDLQLACF